MAMWIRTQNLPNSFSSHNKKTKAVLPQTAPRASVLAKTTSRSQLSLAVAVKSQTDHTVGRSFRQVAHYGGAHRRKQ